MKTEIIILSLIGLFLVWRLCLWLFKEDKPVKPEKPPVTNPAHVPPAHAPQFKKPLQETPWQSHTAAEIKAAQTKPHPKPKRH
jgi:hypothetical protein